MQIGSCRAIDRGRPRVRGHLRQHGARGAVLLSTLLVAGLAGAGSASAATIGQTFDVNGIGGAPVILVQTSVSSGAPYQVPARGTLTSFSTRAWHTDGHAKHAQLAVLRPAGGAFDVVALSSASILLPTSPPGVDLTAEITPIAVRAGDFIALQVDGTHQVRHSRAMGSAADTFSATLRNVVAGETVGMTGQSFVVRASYSANFEPAPVDETPPAISITSPDGSYGLLQVLINPPRARFSCTDNLGGSGVTSCTATADGQPVADGETVPRGLGRHTFTVTATDEAGNTDTRTTTYTVGLL